MSMMEVAAERLRSADPEAVRVLTKILSNIRDTPAEPKFRRLRRENAKVQALLNVPGALDLLRSCGFQDETSGDAAFLVLNEPNPIAAQHAVDVVLQTLRGGGSSGELRLSCLLNGGTGTVRGLAPLPVSGGVVSGGLDNVVRVWKGSNVVKGAVVDAVEELRGHDSEGLRAAPGVNDVLVCRESGELVSAGRDGKVIFWGLAEEACTGMNPVRVNRGHGVNSSLTNASNVSCLADLPILESGDAQRVVSGGWDKTARVWSAADTNAAHQDETHSGVDLAIVATAAADVGAVCMGSAAPSVSMVHDVAVNAIVGVSSNIDGAVVITGCGDGGIRVFRASDGTQLLELGKCGAPVRGICAMPSTSEDHFGIIGIASVSNDGFLRVWESCLRAPQREQSQSCHCLRGVDCGSKAYLYCVAASSSTLTPELYTGGDDGVVTVWSYGLVPKQRIAVPGEVWCMTSLLGPGRGDLAIGCGKSVAIFSREIERQTSSGSAANNAFLSSVKSTALASSLASDPPPRVYLGIEALSPKQHQQHEEPFEAPLTLEMQEPGTSVATSSGIISGPPYEFTFPVEVSTGENLTISWNRQDDPVAVARNFLTQHSARSGLPVDQLDDIVAFIRSATQNGGQSSVQQQQQSAPQQDVVVEADANLMTDLMSMGFGEVAVRSALVMARNNKQRAIELLLG